MSSKAIVKMRQGRAFSMVLHGMSPPEAARQLKVTERTVRRDVKAVQDSFLAEIRKKTAQQIIDDVSLRGKLRTYLLWNLANAPMAHVREKVAAISASQQEDRDLIKRYQLMGILPQDPPKVTICCQNNTQLNQLNLNACHKCDEPEEKPRKQEDGTEGSRKEIRES